MKGSKTMAIVKINGEEFDSSSPHHRQRAYFRHNVEIDEAGNVTAQSLNGLHIETPGNVVSGSPRFTAQSTNVATNNIVGGSVIQSVVSINGSTVNGVVMGYNGPAPTVPATVSTVLPVLRRLFNTYVADVDWAGCSMTMLGTVLEQLWKVQPVSKTNASVALLIREIIDVARTGECPIAYYAGELDKQARSMDGKRLWDVADPAIRAILIINNLI